MDGFMFVVLVVLVVVAAVAALAMRDKRSYRREADHLRDHLARTLWDLADTQEKRVEAERAYCDVAEQFDWAVSEGYRRAKAVREAEEQVESHMARAEKFREEYLAAKAEKDAALTELRTALDDLRRKAAELDATEAELDDVLDTNDRLLDELAAALNTPRTDRSTRADIQNVYDDMLAVLRGDRPAATTPQPRPQPGTYQDLWGTTLSGLAAADPWAITANDTANFRRRTLNPRGSVWLHGLLCLNPNCTTCYSSN